MRLTAYHDDNGTLRAISASSSDAPPSHMELRPAPVRTEIDAPDLPENADPGTIAEYLANALAGGRVDTSNGRARLVSAD